MERSALAVDIGASSGRVLLGELKNKKIELKEIHRFENKIIKKENSKNQQEDCWDLEHLFNQIIKGLKKAAAENIEAASIGIDTWAVDFVLLDKEEKRLGNAVSYRSHRTDGLMDQVFAEVTKEEIYQRTGIQFLQFNTIYQLYYLVQNEKELLEQAEYFLMIPDYLNFLLSGIKANEYTNATSTQLFNIENKDWDYKLLEKLKIPKNIFHKTVKPGTKLGKLKDSLAKKTSFSDLEVIVPAAHDTASAVAAVPAVDDNFAYLSSGTWSLMGIESDQAIVNKKALAYNFTNEGGVNNTFRFLKNIMGLWLIQEVKRELDDKYSHSELVELAKEAEVFKFLIDPNDNRFLNPESMVEEIKSFCQETGQNRPETVGEIARTIFESLAFEYKLVIEQLKEVSEKEINKLHIIGGGVQNEFLNQMIADLTGLEVYAGPVEATAIGNLLMQFKANNWISDLQAGRKIVKDSFEIKKYRAQDQAVEDNLAWDRFKKLKSKNGGN
ncbi:L-rhamnulokinase [Halanaerobium saccharolyticum]|uniref:Rhamnulokinase n=1 Tax=Halanaerobium saccharolyticum TaxID=43595 RepID=A0A4R6LRE1_9FIRM|nr:rhamnulokinase [Halanaerobium saccharolyticum]TDO90046.1 L-rhamnulokinase [Halanaerobium saccharolyticum]